MTASTGGARNLQQVQFGTFEYTQSATAQVRYVDAKTGKDIIPLKHMLVKLMAVRLLINKSMQ